MRFNASTPFRTGEDVGGSLLPMHSQSKAENGSQYFISFCRFWWESCFVSLGSSSVDSRDTESIRRWWSEMQRELELMVAGKVL